MIAGKAAAAAVAVHVQGRFSVVTPLTDIVGDLSTMRLCSGRSDVKFSESGLAFVAA